MKGCRGTEIVARVEVWNSKENLGNWNQKGEEVVFSDGVWLFHYEDWNANETDKI